MSTARKAITRQNKELESKQRLFLTRKLASYNIKHEHIDDVSRNKPNIGEITLKISRKSGKLKKNAKIIADPRHNYSISSSTHCEEHTDVV